MSKRITLAGRRRQDRHQIIRGEKRAHIVARVIDILRDWRLTPFENEAPTRHGLRSALVMQGHSWRASDAEANDLVQEGLRRLSAVRPSWDEGQPEYVIPRENCRWCAQLLPEEEYGGLRRGYFCSAECGRAAILHRDLKSTSRIDRVAMAAHSIIERQNRPTLTCEHCGKLFRQFTSTADDQRYCSHACFYQARRTISVRECRTCGKGFRPKQIVGKASLYCSVICVYRRPLSDRECVLCSSSFTPGHERSLFCSGKCSRRAYKIRHGVVKKLAPPVFDYVFRMAA